MNTCKNIKVTVFAGSQFLPLENPSFHRHCAIRHAEGSGCNLGKTPKPSSRGGCSWPLAARRRFKMGLVTSSLTTEKSPHDLLNWNSRATMEVSILTALFCAERRSAPRGESGTARAHKREVGGEARYLQIKGNPFSVPFCFCEVVNWDSTEMVLGEGNGRSDVPAGWQNA